MVTDGRVLRVIGAAPELLASAVAGAALPLMILLLAGHLYWPVALPLALAAAIAAMAICRTSPEPIDRRTAIATVIAAAIGVAWCAVNSRYSAENLFAHRDPTTYNLAGRWLMDHQSLKIATQPGLFGSPAGYVDASAGFSNSSVGHVYAQGNHLLPVLLAAAGKLFGVAGLLKANTAFTGLALFILFGLARRIVGPVWALAVIIALAVSMPLIYVGRDTLSEPLAVVFLMGGLLLLYRAIAYRRLRDFALAGFVAATAAMVRIDADAALLALVLVAVILLAAAPIGARAATGRQVGALLVAALVPGWLGWADVAWLASGYYHDERTHILLQIAAAAIFVVVGAGVVVISWRPPVRAWLASRRVRFRAGAVASWVIVLAFAGLASRPLWLTAHGRPTPFLEQVQRQAGDAVDNTRTYSEQSVSWQALYFGWPTVLLAVAGYVLLTRRLLRERDYALLGLLTMGLAMSALYLWTPEITPDQVYAARRYVPVIMPALLIAAAYALRYLFARYGQWGRAIAVIGGLTLMVVPAVITAPAFGIREEVPQLAQVRAICAAAGPTGAVLELDAATQYSYQQTIRSYCNIPSLGLPGASAAQLASVRAAVRQHGRTLFVMGSSAAALHLDPGPAAPAPFSIARMTRWPSTLHSVPAGPIIEVVTVYLGTVDADGRVSELARAQP